MSDSWGEIGWCHHCETWQLLRDAPWLVTPYGPDRVPCCVHCRENEPWGLGVFHSMREQGEPVPGKWGVFAVHTCEREHAERQDSFYGWDCDHPTTEVQRFPTVHTHCLDCDERNELRVIGFTRSGGHDWEQDRARPCEHWREHQDAAARAIENPSGRGGRGPVRAKVAGWR